MKKDKDAVEPFQEKKKKRRAEFPPEVSQQILIKTMRENQQKSFIAFK